MHFSQLVRVLFGAAFILHATNASPIPASGPGDTVLEKRTSIKLFHVTSAASAASIKSGGVKLQVKTTAAGHETGDDFNPMGTGGFYATDNSEEDIIEWCKRRNGPVTAKTNCADLVTFTFDESALHSLKYHKFVGPASASEDDQYFHLITDSRAGLPVCDPLYTWYKVERRCQARGRSCRRWKESRSGNRAFVVKLSYPAICIQISCSIEISQDG
ncbi:hypothetical protein F5890DRAFT_1537593 [Lentinula detonsa]|uniref:Uncharacterized protein n=1 Tax=Lentinula detonsa TaxID=2804962 RepID=A0AA38UR82_9AGAR|nr:hypothetical protein F5890DRAFT_1537593 [Lentinula detonsa]